MEHKNSIVVNSLIANSIPLDKNLKRYFIKWFELMCRDNGPSFACDRVKELRELILSYRSDPNRLHKVSHYVAKAPIRKNKRLWQLFRYADTNPHAVLAFLKFYLGEAEPETSVEESQEKMHELLESIPEVTHVPSSLKLWLEFLPKPHKELFRLYRQIKADPDHPFHYVIQHHSASSWAKYWSQWKWRILKTCKRYSERTWEDLDCLARVPVPSLYRDFDGETSKSFNRDFENFLGFFPDSRGGEISLPLEILDWLLYKAEPDRVFNLYEQDDIVDALPPDGWYVGEIHHIPKKGTTTRRPIAVPNRFLQAGLEPFQRYLYEILKRFPRDHTFDQQKSSKLVSHRVNRGHYTCSVDLSKATDYLPKGVADHIIDVLFGEYPVSEDIEVSRQLFDFMSRAPWKNGDHLSKWKSGQPLGTLPSFGMLALEHNLLLESTALACGYLHSPYVVLGDDVLLFSKRMRTAYIDLMGRLGVPLSFHKSYEHNLVEFAGQVFVKNQPTGYTPDPIRVTEYNLFDYSRNSGFLLSYRELPRGIRRWMSRKGRQVSLTGERFYRLSAELYFAVYGSPYNAYMDLTMDVLPFFAELCIVDAEDPEPVQTSGWEKVTHHGEELLAYTGRGLIRSSRTPKWAREKFKPATTRAIVARASAAVQAYSRRNE